MGGESDMLTNHDAGYFTKRALTEMQAAEAAANDLVARAHLQLSDLLLERARSIVADAMRASATVTTLHIVPRAAA